MGLGMGCIVTQPCRGTLGQQEGVCGVGEQCTLAAAMLPSIMARHANSGDGYLAVWAIHLTLQNAQGLAQLAHTGLCWEKPEC